MVEYRIYQAPVNEFSSPPGAYLISISIGFFILIQVQFSSPPGAYLISIASFVSMMILATGFSSPPGAYLISIKHGLR